MAAAEDRHLGNENVVYVADEEPTDPTDPTEYDVLGMRTASGLSGQAPEITIRDVHGTTTTYSTNAETYNIGWNRSRSGDDGQDIVKSAYQANPKTTIWVLISNNEVGDKATHFKGTVGQYTRGDDEGGPSTETATIGLDGTFSETEITE